MRQLGLTLKTGLRSPKLWAIMVVWMITLLYVLFQGGKTSIMLFAMINLLAIYFIVGSYSGVRRGSGIRNMTLNEERGELLYAGDQVRVKLNVHIPGFLPFPYIIVKDVLKRHNGQSWSFEESIIPSFRGKGELRFQTPPLERGSYSFMKTECTSEDIFGLMEHKGMLYAPGQFRVKPRTVFIPYWQLFDRNSHHAGPQMALSSSRRETTQINGVRDYVYGDRISRIHWNATAKTGTWKSKEFEHESVPKTMLILDATASHYSCSEQFELAVSTVSSLLEYGNRERIGIGLCTLGSKLNVFVPSESKIERQKMLYHLVDLDADGQGNILPKLEAGTRRLPQGSYFVLVSPLSGQPVLDIMRWANTYGMSPSHIQIVNPSAKSKPDFTSVLKSRGIYGCSISSLQDLPSAIGGRVS
ncbi:DUF58 domain-containing protein [Paenibacillus sp. IHBB 10380]|uniref:DUF58 domain-containing protein n=1 Tax=Paenibacillus sp. IHBB 10380 TaxID=1566358 RepID=UPI0005CFE848|nr:DUF58 domain-containing protein [Paenibacillus sp. IHBB 10380]